MDLHLEALLLTTDTCHVPRVLGTWSLETVSLLQASTLAQGWAGKS